MSAPDVIGNVVAPAAQYLTPEDVGQMFGGMSARWARRQPGFRWFSMSGDKRKRYFCMREDVEREVARRRELATEARKAAGRA